MLSVYIAPDGELFLRRVSTVVRLEPLALHAVDHGAIQAVNFTVVCGYAQGAQVV